MVEVYAYLVVAVTKKFGPAMLVYPKIAHEVMPIRAIFIVRCG